jgi:hypothetical protein
MVIRNHCPGASAYIAVAFSRSSAVRSLGCEWCSSGFGKNCNGPLGLDDIEVGCDCDCHKCPDCGSAYCETMGGPDPCAEEMDGEKDAH